MACGPEAERLARIRAGAPLEYGYTVYGPCVRLASLAMGSSSPGRDLARTPARALQDVAVSSRALRRVALVIEWDAAAAAFVETRTDRYVDGGCDTSTRPIDEAEALRHVRAAAQG